MHVIVHGGAGSPPEEPADRQSALDAAAERGGGAPSPVGAVCEALGALESDPQFNAGVGGAVQSDGRIRTDAGLMTGDRAVGAACAMPGVVHAVDVARAVMTETPHVLLSGERAVAFAAEQGIDVHRDLWTGRTRERWADCDPPAADDVGGQIEWVRDRFGDTDPGGREGDADDGADASPGGGDGTLPDGSGRPNDHDTVGAVACDGDTLAAATSTGGRWLALAGRVGDVPQVGCGFYASAAGGASATGAGEDIARHTLARRAVQHLEGGASAPAAAEMTLTEFGDRAAGSAGVVVMGADGGAGEAYNSAAMQTARTGTDE
jgi:isoaspartyl peptidase/L-asparaginase-like protein (Ntn-hydrolase superfamily)